MQDVKASIKPVSEEVKTFNITLDIDLNMFTFGNNVPFRKKVNIVTYTAIPKQLPQNKQQHNSCC
jgi:hypothetical protein